MSSQNLASLPFIIKVVTDGLKQHPVLNAAVAGTNIIYRKQYNIGIAVALDWGLIVPVIKNADDLSITGLTRQLNDLEIVELPSETRDREIVGVLDDGNDQPPIEGDGDSDVVLLSVDDV